MDKGFWFGPVSLLVLFTAWGKRKPHPVGHWLALYSFDLMRHGAGESKAG